jgi:hypothetical protein
MLKNPELKKKLDEPSKIFLAIELSLLALDFGAVYHCEKTLNFK